MTQTHDQDGKPDHPGSAGLGRMRRLARLVLWFERLWPAVAPALGVIGVLAVAALFDLPRLLSPILHVAALVAGALAVLGCLGTGIRRVRRPRADEADRRLEADSGLRHQPLAVLTDRPSLGGEQLWAAHVQRALSQVARLTLKAPRPMLAAADPQALRALVLIGLVAGIAVAGNDSVPRLLRALHTGFVPAAPPPASLLEAWITPPAYTGQAPIFLKPEGGPIVAPAGARLTISVTGGTPDNATSEPTLEQDGTTKTFTALDASSFQVEQDLAKGGRIVVRRRGRDLAAWDLTVVEDAAPVVVFPESPGFLRNGTNPQTRLPWQVTHAYGVTGLQADIHLMARPDAPVLVVSIPLPGNAPKAAKGARVQDLTANSWAGLPVTVQLLARDAPGREGRSVVENFTLPERRFSNAVARAIVAVRRQLSLTPDARKPAIAELDRISGLADVWNADGAGFLNLRAVASLLYRNRDATAVPEAQDRLWALALHLEEGAPDRTARTLEAARKELRDTLEAEKQGKTIDRAELDKKIKNLQDALQKRLDALSEQVRRDPDTDAYNPEAHPLDQRDMQKLTEEMRDAAKNSQDDKARDKMAELEKMMEAMKGGRPEHGQMTEQERQRAEKRKQGQQQMTVLQDIIQREGSVLDNAQSRSAELDQMRAPSAASPATEKKDNSQRTIDQSVQLALRRAVGELMQQYADLTGEVPPNLGDADTAMRDSAQALGQSQDGQAAGSALKAIEALQKGGKSMRQQMARQFGRGQEGNGDPSEGEGEDGMAQGEGDGEGIGPGQGQYGDQQGDTPGINGDRNSNRQHATRPNGRGQQRDPLGRPRGEGMAGSDEAGDVQVPEQMEQARTRALQEELRRRGSDRTRSQQELDYIDRLLRQF